MGLILSMTEKIHGLTQLFDYYELRARVIPALLIFLPIILSSISAAYVYSVSIALTTGSIVIAVAIIYALSFIVRGLGRNVESVLWTKWDGPPSTRFMRWSDDFFSQETKREYHKAIESEFGISLKDETAERENKSYADKLIMDTFRQAQSLIRSKDRKGVWNAHNAEYGFLRNIFGSRVLWLTLSLVGTIFCGYLFSTFGNGIALISVIINGFLTLLALLCCILVTPMVELIKQVADRYAESTWGLFITLHRERNE